MNSSRIARRRRARVLGALVVFLAHPTLAAERELDQDSPPGSTKEIETPIERVFPEEVPRPPLFPWFRERLQKLPAFIADTQLGARYRTYYLRKDRTIDLLSEAWAMGGSLYYRSGWLAETFAVELEGFTSQPIVAPDDRGGSLLLAPVQEGRCTRNESSCAPAVQRAGHSAAWHMPPTVAVAPKVQARRLPRADSSPLEGTGTDPSGL